MHAAGVAFQRPLLACVGGCVLYPLQTALQFDEARCMLFAGHSDGSVFVRRLDRVPSGSFGVKLIRYCDPADTAVSPSRITSLHYDGALDRVYTGDMLGLVRLIKKASGIEFEATDPGSKAVAEGRFRARHNSISVSAADADFPKGDVIGSL